MMKSLVIDPESNYNIDVDTKQENINGKVDQID